MARTNGAKRSRRWNFSHNNLEREDAIRFEKAVLLLLEMGEPLAHDAYCEAHVVQLEQSFAESNKVTKASSKSFGCIHQLLKPRSRCNGHKSGCLPPGCDHISTWKRDGKPVYFVYQPYGLTEKTVAQLVQFCAENGLHFDIDASLSWHYPGQTLRVTIWTEEEEKRRNA
jgi:hypothetical protein